jgi:hypothetical protein
MSWEALVLLGVYDDVRCEEDIKAMKTAPRITQTRVGVWAMREATWLIGNKFRSENCRRCIFHQSFPYDATTQHKQ